ncbi:TIR domain-containing protein [Providencia rettgeri]
MYYNVKVEIDEKNKKGNFTQFFDLDNNNLDDVKKHIIIPYLERRELFIDGRYIEHKKVRQLKIFQSERTTTELRDIAQSRVSPNVLFFYNRQSMLSDKFMIDITKELLSTLGDIIKKTVKEKINDTIDKNEEISLASEVFIVHGHDNELKTEIARFIESLDLKPIILHEKSSNGKTIIEKIEHYSNAGFGIVLYTPCDLGCAKDDQESMKSRARQNVVFEHGYLIGKLGRQRVTAIVKGDIEKPNDISGVVYITHDPNEGWKISLVKELIGAGYDIDTSKLFS